ncbi:MAG: DUF2318 domain-containing protein [Candidatus Pacebacteria bacterium]|nr:DUF2318 domain-containing protein [Candidatus Paceibacterota bacterium]
MSKQNILIIKVTLIILIIGIFTLSNKNTKEETNNEINNAQNSYNRQQQVKKIAKEIIFEGEKGETLKLENDKITIDAKILDDGLAHFYNTELENRKMVYFFALKDQNGIYRAAANACQICHKSKLGFVQEGNFMKCKTCGNKYPMEKIATEKGGCNPGPINPNLKMEDGKITIEQSELEEVSDLF